MADVKISGLPAATAALGAMELEVNNAATSEKLTVNQVDDLLLGTTNGMIARTGTNARAARTLTASTGIVVSNGNGVSGNPTVSIDKATTTQIRDATADKVIDPANAYAAMAPVTSSGAGTWAPVLTGGINFDRTMTGNTTLDNPTGITVGKSGTLRFIQDATGGRTLTISGSYWKQIGGAATIDTAANKVNVFAYYVRAADIIELSYAGAY